MTVDAPTIRRHVPDESRIRSRSTVCKVCGLAIMKRSSYWVTHPLVGSLAPSVEKHLPISQQDPAPTREQQNMTCRGYDASLRELMGDAPR